MGTTAKTGLGVVDQVTAACAPKARVATLLGFLLGGFVPLATYMVAHYEYQTERPVYTQVATLLVLGGLLYSAKTVYEWGKKAFKVPAKAAGFVLLIEGVMIVSHTSWLSLAALGYLIAINGIATGCTLALDREEKKTPAVRKVVTPKEETSSRKSMMRLKAVG